jgi:hypothetical protein
LEGLCIYDKWMKYASSFFISAKHLMRCIILGLITFHTLHTHVSSVRISLCKYWTH